MRSPLKIAVLSFAHPHALSYVRALNGRRDIELVAADPDHGERPVGESGGTVLAAQLGVRYLETYEAVWEWGPDAVVICAENVRHLPLVEQAAAQGAHVLCEKPLATSVPDAEAMVSACESAGVNLMVAHPVRFSTAFKALKRAYDAGAVGEVRAVVGANNGKLPKGDRSWFVDPELAGGGSITDHTVHVADLLDSLFDGVAARSVYALSNTVLHGEVGVETGGLISIELDGGVVVTIDCSWSRPDSYPTWGGLTLQLTGDRGIADMDAFNTRVDGHSQTRGNGLWLSYGTDPDTAMIAEFLASIAAGRAPQPDGRSGLRTVRIVQAAYDSVRTGATVLL
ncbi:Gfo/Idh/MocA family oxidoreductase [Occultella glacieicola]|uniref:Gfo/Idh/MocA family oxidoreductase n=1 Tax=Occultella glacieicola TaxID=2518684 RepID=A0ABY2DXG9_9MICO|nr:Gfo/Idh/MocA family oxidoreductase [Occultella glacieicola]TDE88831.1 Gfo/Idh/MocA family oxidoreductase [Occultella glacieicola]